MEKKTSLFENGLIWFGAGVSIAEILTGTYFAPLGMAKGLAAILIGHVIGCILLFLSGVIGGTLQKKCNGNSKRQFRHSWWSAIRNFKCTSACRMDCNYDL